MYITSRGTDVMDGDEDDVTTDVDDDKAVDEHHAMDDDNYIVMLDEDASKDDDDNDGVCRGRRAPRSCRENTKDKNVRDMFKDHRRSYLGAQ